MSEIYEAQPQIEGYHIKIEDLIVWVPESKSFGTKTEKKCILKGINTEFKEGTLNAVVGPSGSGKTTFLNYLSSRQDSSQMFQNSSDFFVNGNKVTDLSDFKNIIGYVLQEDLFEVRLTPREILTHYARLRGHSRPDEIATKVLAKVNLTKCADTVVGDAFLRGLSGGEKKRTSIGVELVASPSILFLDEPTTGLDSSTALDVIMALAELKKSGMTIICTIHQPSEEIMALFDKVVLLVDGNLVYDDSPNNIEDRLSSMGFIKNLYETPIEFFMKVVDKDYVRHTLYQANDNFDEEDVNREFEKLITRFLRKQYAHHNQMVLSGIPPHISVYSVPIKKETKISFLKQIIVNAMFTAKTFYSLSGDFLIVLGMMIFFYLSMIIVYIKTPRVQDDVIAYIQNRTGFFLMNTGVAFFSTQSLTSTTIIYGKPVFMKDFNSKLYHQSSLILGILAVHVPYWIVIYLGWAVSMFFLFGLNDDHQTNLIWFISLILLGMIAGVGVGILISAVGDDLGQVTSLSPVITLMFLILSGFFIDVYSMTWPIRIMSYISPIRYLYQGFLLNEFRNRQLFFDNCKILLNCLFDPNQKCVYRPVQGTPLMSYCDPNQKFNFEQKEIWMNLVFGVGSSIIWAIAGLIIFRIKYREIKANYGFDEDLFKSHSRKDNPKLIDSQVNKIAVPTEGLDDSFNDH